MASNEDLERLGRRLERLEERDTDELIEGML